MRQNNETKQFINKLCQRNRNTGVTRIRSNIQLLTVAESKHFQTGFKITRVSKTKGDVRQNRIADRGGAKLTEEQIMEKYLSTDEISEQQGQEVIIR